jgi:hypothetical protein
MECNARYSKESTKLRFREDKNVSFYLPYRCGNPVEDGHTRCIVCQVKRPTKNITARTYELGDIGDPIPPEAHLFGSQWYEQQVKKYGTPSPATLETAMAAVRQCESSATSATSASGSSGSKSKKPRRPKILLPHTATLLPQTPSPTEITIAPLPARIHLGESTESSYIIHSVQTLPLSSITIQGTQYLWNKSHNWVFEKRGTGAGAYQGTYCTTSHTLVAENESDSDSCV